MEPQEEGPISVPSTYATHSNDHQTKHQKTPKRPSALSGSADTKRTTSEPDLNTQQRNPNLRIENTGPTQRDQNAPEKSRKEGRGRHSPLTQAH